MPSRLQLSFSDLALVLRRHRASCGILRVEMLFSAQITSLQPLGAYLKSFSEFFSFCNKRRYLGVQSNFVTQ